MRVSVKLPQLSMGMSDAEIVQWHVEVGQRIGEGEDLVDVESEKAVTAVPAPISGTVLELAGDVGDVIDVRGLLAVLDSEQ